MKWSNQPWILCTVLLVALTINQAKAAKDWAEPWEEFPQIYDFYEQADEEGSLWFFTKYPPVLIASDAYEFPTLVLRYDAEYDSFTTFDISDDQVPQQVRNYWQKKVTQRAALDMIRGDYPYQPRWPDAIEALDGLSFYEVRNTGLLYHTQNHLQLFLPPSITDEEIRRYGKIVAAQYSPELKLELEKPEAEDFFVTKDDLLQSDTRLGPFVEIEDKIYFGLLGGFSEEVGSFGGIAIFDLKTQQWEVLRHPFLLASTVTSMASDRLDVLWMGTASFAEGQEYAASGLVSYDPKQKEWASYTPKNSDITGDLIRLVVSDGRHVWVATEYGMNRIDTNKNVWESYRLQKPGGMSSMESRSSQLQLKWVRE